jgi:hypothetical protein
MTGAVAGMKMGRSPGPAALAIARKGSINGSPRRASPFSMRSAKKVRNPPPPGPPRTEPIDNQAFSLLRKIVYGIESYRKLFSVIQFTYR